MGSGTVFRRRAQRASGNTTRRLVIVAGAAGVVLAVGMPTLPPASASAVAVLTGVFQGTMSESAGIPVSPFACIGNNTYSLAGSIQGVGAEANGGPPHASAIVHNTWIVVSGSGTECTASGNATAVATCSGSPTYALDAEFPEAVDDTGEQGSTTCSLAGSLARQGTRVTASLSGTVSVTDPSADPSEPAARTYAVELTIDLQYAPDAPVFCRAGVVCLTRGPVYGSAIGKRQLIDSPGPGRPRASAGTAAFQGSATLPTFPCSPQSGPCSGSFSGAWTGGLSGVSGTSVYSVAWSAPDGSLNAAFQYSELQCLAGVETLVGTATGSGSATAQPGQVQGKWQVPGESFARDIIAVSIDFDFSWTRTATSATIILYPLSISLDVSGLGPQVVVSASEQAGSALFAPTSQSGSGVPTCDNPLTNVEGVIAGVVPLADAAV